jgi:long-chain acyl-CoA synthetase
MNLLYGLRRAALIEPDRVAVLDGASTWTWREFAGRVTRAALELRRLGIEPGDRFAVLQLNSARYLELHYAASASRGVIVPCNTRWSAEDLVFAIQDSGAKLLCVDAHHLRFGLSLTADCPGLRVCLTSGGEPPAGVEQFESSGALPPATSLGPDPAPEDLYGLFYTSGTTGGAKGVMLTQANILANAYHVLIETRMTRDWVWLHSAPMFHLADGAFSFALTLARGVHTFIPQFEPAAFLTAVERHEVTAALLLPTMLNMVLAHPDCPAAKVASLRTVFYGGSPMPLDLLRRGIERFGCDFWQAYGLTETSPVLTFLGPEEHHAALADGVKSAGRAVTGVELAILDPDDRPLPPGAVGEIAARGAIVMKGYWNRPGETADALRGGWFHTGDLGVLSPDGCLSVLDRKKDMIKTGGENVYTPEVEAVLYEHPSVLEATVIGIPDEKWGELVTAFVALRPGHVLADSELLEWCRGRLAGYKRPRRVVFVDQLPKSGAGKVQKRLLREHLTPERDPR